MGPDLQPEIQSSKGHTRVPEALSDGSFLSAWFICLQRSPCATVKTFAELFGGLNFMIMMRHYCFTFSTSTSFACPSRGRDALVLGSRVMPGISLQRFHDGASRRLLSNWWTTHEWLYTLHILTSFMSFFRSFDAENDGS